MFKNAFDTGIYGRISNVTINPNEVAVVCDILELMIYDMYILGGRYLHAEFYSSAIISSLSVTLQLVKV